MELEFDKEIDAILRKARGGISAAGVRSDHLDADAMAAFAENALPEKARLMCIEHLADCDRCRKLLSHAMQINTEAVLSEGAEPAIVEPVIETVIPWYQRIFRMPNLAFTFGGLVLVFGGFLGFLVLRQQNDSSNATVSQVSSSAERRSGSYVTGQDAEAMPTPTEVPAAALNSNSMANAAANTAMAAAPNGLAEERLPEGSLAMEPPAKRSGQFQIDGASGSENGFILDGQDTTGALASKKPAAAPPAPTDQRGNESTADTTRRSVDTLPKGASVQSLLKTDKANTDRDEKKAQAPKEESKDDSAKNKQAEDRGLRRDMPAPAAKAGPARGGALQNQNQSNQIYGNQSEMSVTRTVGGKTFSSRDGAWYDSAYHGQPTTNYRRGTDEYKKLDKGLRNIADTIGGTVVMMWRSKAYRIR